MYLFEHYAMTIATKKKQNGRAESSVWNLAAKMACYMDLVDLNCHRKLFCIAYHGNKEVKQR